MWLRVNLTRIHITKQHLQAQGRPVAQGLTKVSAQFLFLYHFHQIDIKNYIHTINCQYKQYLDYNPKAYIYIYIYILLVIVFIINIMFLTRALIFSTDIVLVSTTLTLRILSSPFVMRDAW
jgi:hypothetical protein